MSDRPTRRALIAALTAGGWLCVRTPLLAVALVDRLLVRLDGDYLHISAPYLSFLSGKALERLKSGVSVAFVGQLSLTSSPNAVVPDARSVARFALSYDIWEERFSISRFDEKPGMRRSVSHLSIKAAEAWCLDNLTLDRALLPVDRPFYVQLDLRADDSRDQEGIVGDPGINITRLIEIFSRPAKSSQQRWALRAGPFSVPELKRARFG